MFYSECKTCKDRLKCLTGQRLLFCPGVVAVWKNAGIPMNKASNNIINMWRTYEEKR